MARRLGRIDPAPTIIPERQKTIICILTVTGSVTQPVVQYNDTLILTVFESVYREDLGKEALGDYYIYGFKLQSIEPVPEFPMTLSVLIISLSMMKKRQLVETLGFEPFVGTLNIRLDKMTNRHILRLGRERILMVEPHNESFCKGIVLPTISAAPPVPGSS